MISFFPSRYHASPCKAFLYSLVFSGCNACILIDGGHFFCRYVYGCKQPPEEKAAAAAVREAQAATSAAPVEVASVVQQPEVQEPVPAVGLLPAAEQSSQAWPADLQRSVDVQQGMAPDQVVYTDGRQVAVSIARTHNEDSAEKQLQMQIDEIKKKLEDAYAEESTRKQPIIVVVKQGMLPNEGAAITQAPPPRAVITAPNNVAVSITHKHSDERPVVEAFQDSPPPPSPPPPPPPPPPRCSILPVSER